MSSDRLRPSSRRCPARGARIADIMRYLSLWMVFKDPPEHTRLRRLTGKVLHAKSMQAHAAAGGGDRRWLLDGIGDRDDFDFIAEFAGPLPCLVIMAMLGVPREDLARGQALSDDMALFIGSSRTSPEKYDTAQAATHEMAAFFRELIAAAPRAPRADLLSELVHLRDGDDRLSEDELVATCILLLFAGHETTTNHIANGMLALMRFPGEMQRLRADPAWPTPRWRSCCATTGRRARRCASWQRRAPAARQDAGSRAARVHDAQRRQPRPARLCRPRPARPRPRRRAAPELRLRLHICLGFPLARTEGQVAFPALLRRYAQLEPTTADAAVDQLAGLSRHEGAAGARSSGLSGYFIIQRALAASTTAGIGAPPWRSARSQVASLPSNSESRIWLLASSERRSSACSATRASVRMMSSRSLWRCLVLGSTKVAVEAEAAGLEAVEGVGQVVVLLGWKGRSSATSAPGTAEAGQRRGLLDRQRRVEHAQLDGAELGLGPDVPVEVLHLCTTPVRVILSKNTPNSSQVSTKGARPDSGNANTEFSRAEWKPCRCPARRATRPTARSGAARSGSAVQQPQRLVGRWGSRCARAGRRP
jgi:hypothetical protein